MIKHTDRTSPDYLCTLDTTSAADMQLLAALRAAISADNKASNDPTCKKRLEVRGRKPITKMQCTNRWTGKTSVAGFNPQGNIVGGIKNAGALDVYIYVRNIW
jgi:hypothetical protein